MSYPSAEMQLVYSTALADGAKTYLHQLGADIGYCVEDLLRVMANKEGWQGRECQGNPCYQHDFLSTVMMIYIYIYIYIHI